VFLPEHTYNQNVIVSCRHLRFYQPICITMTHHLVLPTGGPTRTLVVQITTNVLLPGTLSCTMGHRTVCRVATLLRHLVVPPQFDTTAYNPVHRQGTHCRIWLGTLSCSQAILYRMAREHTAATLSCTVPVCYHSLRYHSHTWDTFFALPWDT
jgi:hypothetical protein